MLKNYLKITYRSIKKNKMLSFINMTGLSLGVAVCLFLFTWISNELSYDKFNENSKNIYRAVWEGKIGVNSWSIPLVSPPLAGTLREEFPEVESVTSMLKGSLVFKINNELVEIEDVIYTDNNFFKIFTTTNFSGNPEALSEPNSLVVTTKFADQYLNGKNPIGEIVTSANGVQFKITGIVDQFPDNSHFHFNLLAPINDLQFYQNRIDKWGFATVYTYALLKHGSDPVKFESNVKKYLAENINDGSAEEGDNYNYYRFQSLESIHLNSNLKYELEPNGNILYVYIFGSVALMILILAIINFTNISLVGAMERIEEVGIRKVLGSGKRGIMMQSFLGTSAQVVTSILIAFLIVEYSSRWLDALVGFNFNFSIIPLPALLILLFFLLVVPTISAGSYPAFFLSRFAPAAVIRKQVGKSAHQGKLKTGLVAAQFILSTCIVIGTILVNEQLSYLHNKDLGFEKEHVLVIKNAGLIGKRLNAFKSELAANSGIADATGVQALPGYNFDSTIFEVEQPANVENPSVTYNMIDEKFVDVLKIKMIEGRNFSSERLSDSTAYLINESAAKTFGWDNPIGKNLAYAGMEKYRGPVIGVVEDFNFQSLHNEIKPLIFPFMKWRPTYIAVRLNHGDLENSIEHIKNVWNQFVSVRPFEYAFLDKEFDDLYNKETTAANLLTVFTILSLFIAAIGLLGLVSISVKNRFKEIAIRKVLGASIHNIFLMITREFLIVVSLASIAAWPIVYYGLNKWLEDFAYKIDVNVTVFFVSTSIIVAIAMITSGFLVIRSAIVNPVNSLKDE